MKLCLFNKENKAPTNRNGNVKSQNIMQSDI